MKLNEDLHAAFVDAIRRVRVQMNHDINCELDIEELAGLIEDARGLERVYESWLRRKALVAELNFKALQEKQPQRV